MKWKSTVGFCFIYNDISAYLFSVPGLGVCVRLTGWLAGWYFFHRY